MSNQRLALVALGVWLAVVTGCSTPGIGQNNRNATRNANVHPASNTNSQANVNAAKAAPAATPARASGGTIEIQSTPPGASIVLVSEDEAGAGPPKPYGATPATLTGIAPGKYTVDITKPGFKDYQKEIQVKAGATVKIDARLKH